MLTLFCFGCGGGGGGSSPATSGSGGGINTPSIPQYSYVAIVVLENTDYSDVVGSAAAPYLNSVASRGALASQYYANTHPSIGNYFTMSTGLTITNDDAFTGVVSDDNVVRVLSSSGKTWKSYAQSLPSPGYLGGDTGAYMRHHNPFTYFSDVQQNAAEQAHVVPYTQLASDLASNSLPNYLFIVPDRLHDGHDCPAGGTACDVSVRLAAADSWMSSNMPALLSNAAFSSNGLLIVIFDESRNDNTNGGGRVYAALVGPHVRAGYTANGTYDHRSLLSLTLRALGINSIPNGAGSANQMTEFFQ